ncbi:TetR family transcriptional regulator [Mycolicibacterium thermoresistibile]
MRTAAQLRSDILAAAGAEFAQHGLAGARIDRIAKAANASKERLYAHFQDKEALFRQVVAAETVAHYRSFTLRPDAVPEFVGDVYDHARTRSHHIRMLSWAKLEGIVLDEPVTDESDVPAEMLAAIARAKADGHVDESWDPVDLLVMLFGIGLAWAHWPHPDADKDDPATVRNRRAAAVEAAARVIAPAGSSRL